MDNILTNFTAQLMERLDGPLHFRFFLQPLVAAGFAFRDGLRDAQVGRPPYGWSLLRGSQDRRWLVQQGWKAISKVFILAVVLDLVYQVIALHQFRLDTALIAACLLALIPYLLLRGLINRLTMRRRRSDNRPLP